MTAKTHRALTAEGHSGWGFTQPLAGLTFSFRGNPANAVGCCGGKTKVYGEERRDR